MPDAETAAIAGRLTLMNGVHLASAKHFLSAFKNEIPPTPRLGSRHFAERKISIGAIGGLLTQAETKKTDPNPSAKVAKLAVNLFGKGHEKVANGRAIRHLTTRGDGSARPRA